MDDFNHLIDDDVKKMTPEERRALLLRIEEWTDEMLRVGQISQMDAWDSYFGLLHECDMSGFGADRERIIGKINVNQYNPFCSKNPATVFLARLRARIMGLDGKN